jgi:hypothetical protein
MSGVTRKMISRDWRGAAVIEDENVLAQMFDAVQSGGGLLVTVPQHPFLWSASDQYAMHQRRYNCTELRRKVESAGFQIQRITSFNSLLLPLMIWSRLRRKREHNFQPWREFEIGPTLNKTLESIEIRTNGYKNRRLISGGRIAFVGWS